MKNTGEIMKRSVAIFLLSLLAGSPISAQQPLDLEAEKEKVAQTISSVIGWAKDKDLELFYGSIANDEDYISVTPTKRIIKRFNHQALRGRQAERPLLDESRFQVCPP